MAVCLVCYTISFILARQCFYMLSRLVLVAVALWLYIEDYRETGNLIYLRGLLCPSFMGGQGISYFKLNCLQTDWNLRIWVHLGLMVLTFWTVFKVLHRIYDEWNTTDMRSIYRFYVLAESPLQAKRLSHSMAVLVVISSLALFFGAQRLDFVPPFLCSVPHVCSYLHVNDVRHSVVSYMLVSNPFVVYDPMIPRRGRGLTKDQGFWPELFIVMLSLTAPVFCVPRLQSILVAGMAILIYISMSDTSSLVYMNMLMAYTIPAYLLLTVMCSHNARYLNGIFEMRNSHMPVFITQSYVYTTNDHDNLNRLVEQLESRSLGLRILFSVRALTGFKFLFSVLVSFPLSVTEKELTISTLFYDTYYGFGISGMVLLDMSLRIACYLLVRRRRKMLHPADRVVYVQVAMYIMLPFFTIWFSNPTTQFYLVVIGIIYMYVKS